MCATRDKIDKTEIEEDLQREGIPQLLHDTIQQGNNSKYDNAINQFDIPPMMSFHKLLISYINKDLNRKSHPYYYTLRH